MIENAAVADEKIQRVLEVFNNATDELVAEHQLVNFDLHKFRAWFKEDGGDTLMYYGYKVEEKDITFLSAYLSQQISFNFETHSYFVSAYMDTEDWVAKYGKDASRPS